MPFSPSKFREKAQESGRSCGEISVAAGRSYPTVQGYLHGNITPPLEVAERLARAVECELTDLLEADQ